MRQTHFRIHKAMKYLNKLKAPKPVRCSAPAGKPTALFSGNESVGMWRHINEAKTFDNLRMALYVVTCRCQDLESEVRRLANDKADRGRPVTGAGHRKGT